jgi:Predicted O-methyltransferase
MSTQIEINQDLIKYLQNLGYRKDTVVDKLERETKALGSVAQMQIAKEQGQFLEIIVKTSKAKIMFRDWKIYRFKYIIYGARTST